MYIYQNHMGGLYTDERELTDDQLFCDVCFASDELLGEANSADGARRVLNDTEIYDLYGREYCEQFIKENFT